MKNKVTFDFESLGSDFLNVRYVEFFKLGEAPDENKGDWGDEFAVWNYFIPEGSIKIYNDQIFMIDGNAYFSIEEVISILDENLSTKVLFNGKAIPGIALEGLFRTAVSGDNDVQEAYEFFGDIEIIEGVDDLSSDYSGNFGCRVWSFDVDGGKVQASQSGFNLDFSNSEYADDGEYAQMREDDVSKSIAVVTAQFE